MLQLEIFYKTIEESNADVVHMNSHYVTFDENFSFLSSYFEEIFTRTNIPPDEQIATEMFLVQMTIQIFAYKIYKECSLKEVDEFLQNAIDKIDSRAAMKLLIHLQHKNFLKLFDLKG